MYDTSHELPMVYCAVDHKPRKKARTEFYINQDRIQNYHLWHIGAVGGFIDCDNLKSGQYLSVTPASPSTQKLDALVSYMIPFIDSEIIEDIYDSILDMLVSEFYPGYKSKCMDYYSGRGPSITKLHTPKEIAVLDASLLSMMKVTLGYYLKDIQNDTFFVHNLHKRNIDCTKAYHNLLHN